MGCGSTLAKVVQYSAYSTLAPLFPASAVIAWEEEFTRSWLSAGCWHCEYHFTRPKRPLGSYHTPTRRPSGKQMSFPPITYAVDVQCSLMAAPQTSYITVISRWNQSHRAVLTDRKRSHDSLVHEQLSSNSSQVQAHSGKITPRIGAPAICQAQAHLRYRIIVGCESYFPELLIVTVLILATSTSSLASLAEKRTRSRKKRSDFTAA